MNTDPNKRQVLITNAKTGESRLSEPVPVRAPRAKGESPASLSAATSSPPTPLEAPSSAVAKSPSGVVPLEAATQTHLTAQASAQAVDDAADPL